MQHTIRIISGIFTVAISLFYSISPAVAGFVRPMTFPVTGENHFTDDFGDPRSGGRVHLGNDIISKKMMPVVAVADGIIRYLVIPEASWGFAIYLQDNDGWEYRYLHLNNDTPGTDDGRGGPVQAYAPGIERGTRVAAGQHIAWVGDSGNAESVGSHLHFEMYDQTGTVINPYESLRAATLPSSLPPQGGTGVTTVLVIPIGGELIKYKNDPRVYLLADGIKYYIADEYTFMALNFRWDSVRVLSDSEQYRSSVPLRLVEGVAAVYEDGTPVTAKLAPKTIMFTQELRVGSRGDQVIALQSVLSRLGYYHYTITGYFGSITRDAVLAFQRANSISPVGNVGPQTRAALNAL